MRHLSIMNSARWAAALLACGFGSAGTRTLPALTLGWDAGAGVAGYRVYYGGASRSYTNYVDVGSATTASLSNLSAGADYFFSVTAYNTLLVESGYSAEISCAI